MIFGKDLDKFFIPPELFHGGNGVTPDLQTTILLVIIYYLGILLAVATFITVCYIIYSGYMMFTAFGNEAKYTQAKKTLQYAIIGFLISLLANFIIVFYVRLLGYTPFLAI